MLGVAPKVVLDTNVILRAMMGASAASAVLDACAEGSLQLIYSQKLMYEVAEKLQTAPRVVERVAKAAILDVTGLVVKHGRCASDRPLRIPNSRMS